MSMVRGFDAGAFGMVRVSTPFVNVASIFSRSTSFGTTKLRVNDEFLRSLGHDSLRTGGILSWQALHFPADAAFQGAG